MDSIRCPLILLLACDVITLCIIMCHDYIIFYVYIVNIINFTWPDVLLALNTAGVNCLGGHISTCCHRKYPTYSLNHTPVTKCSNVLMHV